MADIQIPLAGNGDDAASLAALTTLRTVVLPRTLGKVAGVDYAVAGETAGTHDFNEQMKARMPWVIAFVLALAFLLLLATFRSVVIPLTAIVLNLLSVGAAYGLLVLIFQHTGRRGSSASPPTTRSRHGCRCSCSSSCSGSRWTTTSSSSAGSRSCATAGSRPRRRSRAASGARPGR